MTWLPLQDARQLTGHDTVSGLSQWIKRWNENNPDALIIRVPGKVEIATLRSAMREHSRRFTPGGSIRKSIANKKRSRTNGPASPERKQQ